MYIYIFIHTYVRTYVRTYVCVYIYICIHTHTYLARGAGLAEVSPPARAPYDEKSHR